MKPLIGVTASMGEERTVHVAQDNIDAVGNSGGVPVILPNLTEMDQIKQLSDKLDGLLVTGGGDIDPTLFSEEPHRNLGSITPERDLFETELIRFILNKDIPVLAICRGCQILNIAAGGDMYQDLYSQKDGDLLQHQQRAPRWHGSHFVQVREDSLLHQITAEKRFKVNSYHHQAVRHMAPSFRVSATASDGVIEAFESTAHTFVIGVEWHPENMLPKGDTPSQKLFQAFIQACRAHMKRGV
jgi:putative glutamine amidotransferase